LTLGERLGLKCKFRTSQPTNGRYSVKNFAHKKTDASGHRFFKTASYQVI
jgi:hypothetical protein